VDPTFPAALGLYDGGHAVDHRAGPVCAFELGWPDRRHVPARLWSRLPAQSPQPLHHGLHSEARSLAVRTAAGAVRRPGLVDRTHARALSVREFLAQLGVRAERGLRRSASALLLVAAAGIWAGPCPG